MKDFRQRKQSRRGLNPTLVMVVLSLVFILLARSAYLSCKKKNKANIEQKKYDTEFLGLSERIEYLRTEIDKLKTENGIREELKKNNNVGEPGESIIRVVETRS